MVTRLFIPEPFSQGAPVLLTSDHLHYLRNVLRFRDGDTVHIFNGSVGEWRCRLQAPTARVWELVVEEKIQAPAPVPYEIWAYLAPIKTKPLEWVLEKITELGVTHIQFVITERTNVRDINIPRMTKQLIAATEQCGRLSPPLLAPKAFFKPWILGLDKVSRLYIGDERRMKERQNILKALSSSPSEASFGFLVGPEGGFTEAEFSLLENIPNAERISLGPWTLRAETAAIALAAYCIAKIS